MFTGIVEEVGTISAIEKVGNGLQFTIAASLIIPSLAPGDSISVDGACQTVTALLPNAFRVQAIETTLGRTVMRHYSVGTRVNLERPLALGGRLGGHLVQGHVDGVGTVTRVEKRDELVLIECTLPPLVAEVTILHGSVTLNGVSLTVNALPQPQTLQVAIIPFTLEHTTLSGLREGDPVNLEGDMIGKYVRHLAGPHRLGGNETSWSEKPARTDLPGPPGYSTSVSDDI